jgi:uncharacterized protein (DUF1684 family)
VNLRPFARTASITIALGTACGTAPPPPPLPSVDESKAFQAQEDAHFRDDAITPLTASFSRYVADGERLSLGIVDGKLAVDDPEHAQFIFEQRDGRLACRAGCGPGERTIEALSEHELGRFTLLASPQSGPGRVVLHDPQAAARREFHGRNWGPLQASSIVLARFETDPTSEPMPLTTSRGLRKELPVAGRLLFELGGENHELVGFVSGEHGDKVEILVPFFDQSNGAGSYPTGRYLNLEVARDQTQVVLDFNRATNPYCAYSEHYNCPVPPPSNRLATRIEAGELLYAAH